MLKNEVVQTMSLNIKFSYLAENSKFSKSNSYFSILTPTFLRDGFLNSCFQNPSENSALKGANCISLMMDFTSRTQHFFMNQGRIQDDFCRNSI